MRELRDYQSKALQDLRYSVGKGLHRPMLQASTGCHSAGTKIIMANGTTKLIEEVDVGEMVIGPDSLPRKILKLHHGVDQMYRVTPVKGEPFIVNGGHIFHLWKVCEGFKYLFQKAGYREIECSEYFNSSASVKHVHKLHRSSLEFEKKKLPIDPWLLGVILGDGCITQGPPGFCNCDVEIYENVRVEVEKIGLELNKTNSEDRADYYSIVDKQSTWQTKNRFKSKLIKIGLDGCGSGEKFVPDDYLISSRSQRLELISGMLDTDGHMNKAGYDWISKSKRMADNLVWLCRSVGLFAKAVSCEKSCQNNFTGKYYRVSISGDCSIIPCRVERKKAPKRQQKKRVDVTGFSLEKIGVGEYYGFELSGDHLYLTDDFVVHHNSGKTILATAIVESALAKGNRVCFCVPAISLIDQTVQSFFDDGISDVGVIQADHPMTDYSKPVQVASVQTLNRRKVPDVDVVIVDEAHVRHKSVANWMAAEPNKVFIGLSATPWSKGLGKNYNNLIVVATTRQLIDQGYLSDFEVWAYDSPDLSKVRTVAGDYHEGDVAAIMDGGGLVANAVDTWLEHGPGNKTLCFCVNRAHARHMQDQFVARGVSCNYIDAYTKLEERGVIKRSFERGDTQVVVNVGCLTTGVDWDVRCISLCAPTKSEIKFTQIIGRGLRTADGKSKCQIFDHSNSHQILGFVTDIHHEILDDGKGKGPVAPKERQESLPKVCDKCSYMKPAGVHQCPSCGFAPVRREAIETASGSLSKIKAGKKQKYSYEEKIAIYGQLKQHAYLNRFADGWIAHKYREMVGVWPRSLDNPPRVPITPEMAAWIKAQNAAFKRGRAKNAA